MIIHTKKIDGEIERLFLLLKESKPEDAAYSTIVDNIRRLHKLQEESKEKPISKDKNLWLKQIDPNVIITVVGSLVSLIIVLKHEELNVITSKAFGLINRLRF